MSRFPEAVICAPIRTPMGTYNGALKSTAATDLGATAIRHCSAPHDTHQGGAVGKDSKTDGLQPCSGGIKEMAWP